MNVYMTKNKPQSEMTAKPSEYPQGYFKDKPCKKCGTMFSPQAPSHMYCSQGCADIALSDRYLKRTYSIDTVEYGRLHKSGGGKCMICGGEGFKMKDSHKLKLVVDHDHTTGRVRGLLCHNCNRALGLFKDNVQSLTNAINYLESATTIPEGSTLQANGNGSSEPLLRVMI